MASSDRLRSGYACSLPERLTQGSELTYDSNDSHFTRHISTTSEDHAIRQLQTVQTVRLSV